jgi:predicted O-methyltransferase YrrM
MAAHLNREILHELLRRSGSFPLEADIEARIGRSTLDGDTLRFLGLLVTCKRPNHIFECGTGISTLLLARMQQALGTATSPALVSIDHSHRYLGETRRALGANHDALLIHAPLAVTEVGGKVFTTYHPDYARQIPSTVKFDFVFIDGPPAFRYGREAPLYHLAPRLASDALIVLANACREPEQEALRNWSAAWSEDFSVEVFPDLHNGLAVLSIGDGAQALPQSIPEDRIASDLERLAMPLENELHDGAFTRSLDGETL